MSFFKKRPVALLLTILIVIVATLLSVHVKFGAKCQAVSDTFYDGVEANGYTQKSIASHLKNINAYADGLITIARNYDIDTEDCESSSEYLKMALNYSRDQAPYIHYEYESLLKEVNTLVDQLERASLSDRDADGVSQYLSSINGAKTAIESAGYNEHVREFIRKYDHFPTNVLAALAGVEMPLYFE